MSLLGTAQFNPNGRPAWAASFPNKAVMVDFTTDRRTRSRWQEDFVELLPQIEPGNSSLLSMAKEGTKSQSETAPAIRGSPVRSFLTIVCGTLVRIANHSQWARRTSHLRNNGPHTPQIGVRNMPRRFIYRLQRVIAHARHAARNKYYKSRHIRGHGGRRRRSRG
jgi:hypothetical protein